MKILHVDNLMLRRYGNTKVATGRKLFNGMIRNNYKVLEFSERDIAKFEAPLGIKPLGFPKANRRLIETAENFQPDTVLIGHCDIIRNETLREIRRLLPQVKIIYRNVDPLWEPHNVERIRHRMETADAIFISTGGEPLKQFCNGKNIVTFIPNPTDPCVEDQNNALKTEFDRDLVFCGVGNKTDKRYAFVKQLHEALDGTLRFDSFGMHGHPAVWGRQYDEVISGSKMGLNLNRFEDWPLYSSARISQLMGNGLLTFLWDKGGMRRLFTDDQVVFFKDAGELAAKAKAFQADDARRQAVAGAGRAFYHEQFSGQRVVQFMVETALRLPYSHDFIWSDEVYR
jgi:hypothetical protein